jgi:DNA-binding MarR family transcriptional regulator
MHGVLGYRLAQATVAAIGPFLRAVGDPHKLRPVEYSVLCLIADNPGASPGRLASALALTKPNVTLWLDRLESRALIERSPSPTDGRAFALFATAAGRKLATKATEDLLDAERHQFDRLSSAERAMLTELLHKLGTHR